MFLPVRYPPLNEQQWLAEFEKYRQTPQYHLLNFDFTLGDFKFIFFWEWFHRNGQELSGRICRWICVVPMEETFQKRNDQSLADPVFTRGFTGADRLDHGSQRPNRLMRICKTHKLACILSLHWDCCAIVSGSPCNYWLKKNNSYAILRCANGIPAILCYTLIQLLYGALNGGHKAATAAPTWPTINGRWVPDRPNADQPGSLTLSTIRY
jgi:cytochrome c oxidase assembly protein subunit 15